MAEAFTFFWKSRLSQWHQAPFTLGAVRFTHAEQFMMYAKSLLFGDRDAAERILQAATPREQQAIGRTVRGFDEAVWILFREGIVYAANYARFSQNPEQRGLLFATQGTTLVEASPHDQVWGIGLAADDPRALDRSQWCGLNLLGQALTRVREALLWELGIGFVAYSPLGRGFLTGQFRRFEDLPENDYRRKAPRFQGENFNKNLQLVERVRQIAAEKKVTPSQLALAWLLEQGKDVVPIPGTKRRKYLEENAAAVNVRLTPEEMRRIDEAAPKGFTAGQRYPDMSTVNR